jgi:PAS domain S-box-containing protein/putative nucleotidyltransferase with HDIG domain
MIEKRISRKSITLGRRGKKPPDRRDVSETCRAPLGTVFDSTKSVVYHLDRKGRLLRVSETATHGTEPRADGAEKKSAKASSLSNKRFDVEDIVRSGKPRLGIVEEHVLEEEKRAWSQTDAVPCFDDEGEVAGVIVVSKDITERVKAKQSLIDSQLKLREATGLASVYFWEMDMTTRTFVLNDDFYAFHGTTAEQEGGYRMSIPAYTKRFVHPEDRAVSRRHGRWLRTHRGVDAIPDLEHRAIRADGEVRHLLVRTKVVRDAGGKIVKHYGALQDVTEHRRAERKYRDLFENANEAIVIAQGGKIAFLNPAAARLVGHSVHELLGKPVGLGIHPDDRERVLQRHPHRTMSDDTLRVAPHRLMYPDGSVRWVKTNTVSIDWDGKPAWLNFLVDITDRMEAEEKLESTLDNLRKAIGGTIQVIVQVVERRDPYTAGHQRRVADLARSIATEMGLSHDMIDGIRIAAMMHDIGKISVPAEILSKPGSLSRLEFGLIKEHPRTGYEILKDVEFPWPIAEIVYQHHERLDGSGYPRGLKGPGQLLEARIIALADVVEAIASHRPYRPSLGIDVALEEIRNMKGKLYDPNVVDAALRLFETKKYKLV